MTEFEQCLNDLFDSFRMVGVKEIPQIDLYIDQVTTFLENKMKPISRDPDKDKIMTRTMINNYTKAGILPPPVKKKYGTDQMLILMFVYYMKNFLSMSDIRSILGTIPEGEALSDVYESVTRMAEELKPQIREELQEDIDRSGDESFMLISRLCMEIYIRKLYLERIVDSLQDKRDSGK